MQNNYILVEKASNLIVEHNINFFSSQSRTHNTNIIINIKVKHLRIFFQIKDVRRNSPLNMCKSTQHFKMIKGGGSKHFSDS